MLDEVDIVARIILADWVAPDSPAQVGPRLAQVKISERPVLGPAGEPEVGEVVADVRHDVGLGREQVFQGLHAGRQIVDPSLRGRGGRCSQPLPAVTRPGRRYATIVRLIMIIFKLLLTSSGAGLPAFSRAIDPTGSWRLGACRQGPR